MTALTSSSKRHLVLATGVVVAFGVTIPAYAAYAAGGSGKSTASSSTRPAKAKPTHSTKPAPVTPYTPPPVPGHASAPKAKRVSPSGHFSVSVDRTGKKPMDKTWPSASGVFTAAELRQVLPGLTAVKAEQCHTGDLPGGGSIAKSTTCTLDLTISGEPAGDRSKLLVNIRGFGLPQQIGKQWTRDLATARSRSATRPGLYTFYPNKSLGTSAAFTDGTTTEVLVQHGDVSGEIWFSGIGFTKLTNDYLKSRRLYRTSVVPSLVQLLGAKFTPTEKAAA